MDSPWFKLANEAEIPSPALLVYVERAEENIRRMIAIAGGTERLRPHVKTHKMPALIERKLRAGIRKFKCATIAEAEMTARSGAPDVLLAMQPVGPNIGRLVNLIRTFPKTKFSTIVDDSGIALQLSDAATAAKIEIDVFVDLDTGMHRCGISPGPRAAELYKQIVGASGLRAKGIHAYDGHIHEAALAQRIRTADEANLEVDRLVADLRDEGLDVETVLMGWTPTSSCHAKR